MSKSVILAGFGGQGILFSGKVLAYAGLIGGKEVSWLPSYGPEMRGGTANCTVCIDDVPIASPFVLNPDYLIALNHPSFTKFVGTVAEDGVCVADSSMIKIDEVDASSYTCKMLAIPATRLAIENELSGLANIIALGLLIRATDLCDMDLLKKGIEKSVPARKTDMLSKNISALELGYNYSIS